MLPRTTRTALCSILESSYDGIFITDGEANVLMANKAYETITGLKREDLISHNMKDLVASQVMSASGSLRVLSTGSPVTMHQEFQTGKKALISSSPVFDENGTIVMVVTNVRDMTELYALQQQVEQSSEEHRRISRELTIIKNEFMRHDLIARSPVTRNVLRLADSLSEFDSHIILLGEAGVGKGVYARYIHEKSQRGKHPFLRVSCGAIPKDLLERELFGSYKESAEQGSSVHKAGVLEVANKGTVFLDEIGDLPLSIQERLLHTLKNGEIREGNQTLPVDVRIIASTSRNLEEMIADGTFREDLYYQLMVLSLNIPPLRQRSEDLVPLVEHFAGQVNKKYGFQKKFSPEALQVMKAYAWPGNIRELKNVVCQALIVSKTDLVMPEDLPLVQEQRAASGPIPLENVSNLPAYLSEIEQRYIEEAYRKFGNVRDAAKSLGLSPSTFVRKRQKNQDQLDAS